MIDSTTAKSFKQGIAKGLGFGVGASIALATTTLFAAAAAMKIFSAGEVISASELNRNFTIAAPEGAVMAFDLASCPEGWTLADGTNGTHDLRGRFIRGLDKVGARAAGVDPEGATRKLGSEQLDAFQGHKHMFDQELRIQNVALFGGSDAPNYGPTDSDDQVKGAITDTAYGKARVATETRPRNVALIYCMRKN